MPLERGGRADKIGNRYEVKCIISELLKLISEKNYSIVIEALGDDERGTDILVNRSDGIIEHQQCKARNSSNVDWSVSDLQSRGILEKWKFQLERTESRCVALTSPIACSFLVDLHSRACNTSRNPKDFFDYQIENSDKKFVSFYQKFCNAMSLDVTEEIDIAKSIDFLRRIRVNQLSEDALEENVFRDIEWHFVTAKNIVYNALYEYVANEDIYGSEITLLTLKKFLEKQKLVLRLRDGDETIAPLIEKFNREYRSCFRPLKEGLLDRREATCCIDYIRNGKSFIISGNAGVGKSGCTEAILNFCEKEEIPHIAIKLDRRIPVGNCELWGKQLGFQGSFSYALDMVSRNQISVIILDQLDALRWTQANSSEALSVCMELIRQVRYINYERTKKMVLVFVCREYDLKNDNNICSLFQDNEAEDQKTIWGKVTIGNLDENEVKRIVADQYENMTVKTKDLLKTPANLYIWQQLDEKEKIADCTTSGNLIETWYYQIRQKSGSVGVEETAVTHTVDTIVNKLEQCGRLYILKKMLSVEVSGLEYLISTGLLFSDGKKVGFVHQSILDYFISKSMMDRYLCGERLETIIGERNRQTPGKRYQVQMFLQNLLEYDSSEFLAAGDEMLASNQMRFYMKYVFYEILRQIKEPDETTEEYLLKKWKDSGIWKYIVNEVYTGNHRYVKMLREHGTLDEWMTDEERRTVVFQLLESVSMELDEYDSVWIQKYAFQNEEDDKQLFRCFLHDISCDSDAMFELRMLFYEQYPQWTQGVYLDVKSILEKDETRYIRMIAFWLKHNITSEGKKVYYYEESLLECEGGISIQNENYVLKLLLPYIPKEAGWKMKYSEWCGNELHQSGLERATVEIIKKANQILISRDPKLFGRDISLIWEKDILYLMKFYCMAFVIYQLVLVIGFYYIWQVIWIITYSISLAEKRIGWHIQKKY